MADQTLLNGSLLLHTTEPSSPATSLSVERTDSGVTAGPLARISLFGAGASNAQGVLTVSTMDTGVLQERLRVHTNGSVGIGVSAPTERLEVAGTVKAAAFTGDGSALAGVQDHSRVAKSGDAMTGRLTLPANGLVVGGTQLQIDNNQVRIGAPLTVSGGAITPAAGSTEQAGLLFPKDPAGGSGDAAWVRYYPRTGESMTLEIGISNDPDDHIALMASGGVGIGTTAPKAKLQVQGNALVNNGSGSPAVDNNFMAAGSLTIGGITKSFGGGSGWNVNTAGLLLETLANTEIAVHDSGTRVASLAYYEGDTTNRITIGRDMGWGAISEVALMGRLRVNGDIFANGNVGIGTNVPAGKLDVRGAIRAGNSDLYFTEPNHNHSGIGNANGFAAIENAKDYDALMILGRAGTSKGRAVRLWDYLQVNGALDVTGFMQAGNGGRFNGIAIGGLPAGAIAQFPWPYETLGVIAGNHNLRLHSTNNVYFHTANNANAGVAIDADGNLGTQFWSPTPRTSGWGGGIHTWDVEAEGTMWSRSGYQTGPRDLAENYVSEEDLQPGDVVCVSPDSDSIGRSRIATDPMLLGVVSTKPGFLLNVDDEAAGQHFPVALCGRVPCKVVAESGPIHKGDLLTSSSTPGHAMKAVPITTDGEPLYRPGTIIGKALESCADDAGTIEIFVFSS